MPAPKEFDGTVALAQMIQTAEAAVKSELGIEFSHVTIALEQSKQEVPAPTKNEPHKTKTVDVFTPVITAYHGLDDDDNLETYNAAQFNRITAKSKVTSIPAKSVAG